MTFVSEDRGRTVRQATKYSTVDKVYNYWLDSSLNGYD